MIAKKHLVDFWWKIRWSSRATATFHVLAMNAPFNLWRLFFYRLRGVKIGRNVYIAQGTFLEESRPWLIEIHDDVRIGAGVIIVTHDGVYHPYGDDIPYRYGKVVLRKKCTLCPGSIIIPNVTVGECAVVAPGAVVIRDVPPRKIVSGNPAKILTDLDEAITIFRKKSDRYRLEGERTKYPWRLNGSR